MRNYKCKFTDVRTLAVLTALTNPKLFTFQDNVMEHSVFVLHKDLRDYMGGSFSQNPIRFKEMIEQVYSSFSGGIKPSFSVIKNFQRISGDETRNDEIIDGEFWFGIQELSFLFEICALYVFGDEMGSNAYFTHDFVQSINKSFAGKEISTYYWKENRCIDQDSVGIHISGKQLTI